MHIGFLTFESPYGSKGCGVAAYLRAMIPALLSAGHRVTLIAPAAESDREHRDGPVRTLPVKLPNAHWYMSKVPVAKNLLTLPLRELEWSLEFRRSVERAMREDPMDVLEVTELGSWWVSRNAPVPVVARLHGSEFTFSKYTGQPVTTGSALSRNLQRSALNQAAAVTAPSRSHAAEVTREMNWPEKHVAVVPNAISQEMLALASEPCAPGQSESSPMILYTGRLAPVKGTSILLEAAEEVLKQFPAAEFVLAGPWQMPFPTKAWADRTGLAKRISWTGPQSQRQLAELYRRAAVFVMPSFYETFGISCLEAMAFGAPVVSTQAGALVEVIDEKVGMTVPTGDPKKLAGAICRLLADAGLRRRLGAAGRERVLANYTPEAVRDAMVGVYRQASTGARYTGRVQ